MHLVLNENYRVVINDFTFILQKKKKAMQQRSKFKVKREENIEC